VQVNQPKLHYFPALSGEKLPNILGGRITNLLESGQLEQAFNSSLTLENSKIMLCGNPKMVQDVLALLKKRNFSLALSRKPGQIAVENYW